MKYDLIVLTDDRYEQPTECDWQTLQVLYEDEMLINVLRKTGLKVKKLSWSNPDFDWKDTRSVLFRSTWDYYYRIEEFIKWSNHIACFLTLINPQDLIQWNLNKSYLLDLESKGIPIVKTILIEPGEAFELNTCIERLHGDEFILKPQVSGSAYNTFRINKQNSQDIQTQLKPLMMQQGFLIQPYQKNITALGEISLIFINGTYTHAVIKKAASGDFRVQTDHGGSVNPYLASTEEIQLATQAIQACGSKPIYARVDLIRDNNNRLALMELELIEPELFFRFNQQATFQFADAIMEILS